MPGSTPVVLLVEDEPALAEIFLEYLGEAGFEVSFVPHGRKAMAVIEEGQFSALVTDIKLPFDGPDGWEIAHRARELNPDLPVIYMSGNSAVEWSANGVPKSVMLQKPFAPAQLVTAVATLLNAVPPP